MAIHEMAVHRSQEIVYSDTLKLHSGMNGQLETNCSLTRYKNALVTENTCCCNNSVFLLLAYYYYCKTEQTYTMTAITTSTSFLKQLFAVTFRMTSDDNLLQ